MKKGNLRLDGLVQFSILEQLRQMGLGSFQFNFDPRALNFMPLHQFQNIMMKWKESNVHSITLSFPKESELVLVKFVEVLRNILFSNTQMNYYFELEDMNNAVWMEKQGIPFWIVVKNEFPKLEHLSFCQGVVVSCTSRNEDQSLDHINYCLEKGIPFIEKYQLAENGFRSIGPAEKVALECHESLFSGYRLLDGQEFFQIFDFLIQGEGAHVSRIDTQS